MTIRKVYKRLSDRMWTSLAASLEELITKDPPGRPMRTLVQKRNIFRSTVRKDIAGALEIQILCYEERSVFCQSTHRGGRGRRTGSRGTPWRCRRRRSVLLAHLTTAFPTILCGASLSYRSMQRLTTKLRAWSRRWRRWWGPLIGTPWQRHARGSGPASRMLSPLIAILLNNLILNMFICSFFFGLKKFDVI